MNSMILHELFFDGLGDQSEPSSALRNAIVHDFGSYERWHTEFVAMGAADRVLIVSRNPPKLTVFASADGAIIASVDTCGDSDDVFGDRKRGRVYVSCGAGFIDVFDVRGSAYGRIAHIPTATGARTSLFVPYLDVFLLAVRATGANAAAVWVFKPSPLK